MKKTASFFQLILVAALLAAPARADDRATVVRVSGTVLITRKGSSPEPALKGAQLGPGDKIQAAADGKADLLVGGSLKALAAGEELAMQEADSPWLKPLMAELASLVSQPEESSGPGASRHTTGSVLMISPVDTGVRAAGPILQWKPAGTGGDYEVVIRDSLGEVRMSKSCAEPKVEAASEKWTPKPGERYVWSVAYRPAGKPAAAPSEAWFSVLSPKESKELSDDLGRVAQAAAGDEAKQLLAQALLLEKRQCFEDARRLLSRAAAATPPGQWTAAAKRHLKALGGEVPAPQ